MSFNLCFYCENMDCERDGLACMVRSTKKSVDGFDCGDFDPNLEFYLDFLVSGAYTESF